MKPGLVALALSLLSLTACGGETGTIEPIPVQGSPNDYYQESGSKPSGTPSDTPTSEAPAEEAEKDEDGAKPTSAEAAATEVLRAFFSVKAKASDPFFAKADAQGTYMVNPEDHPSMAYKDSMPAEMLEEPWGVEEKSVRMVLDTVSVQDDEVVLSFKTLTLTMQNGEPGYSRWDGEATLVSMDGKWLIQEITMDRIAGGTDKPDADMQLEGGEVL